MLTGRCPNGALWVLQMPGKINKKSRKTLILRDLSSFAFCVQGACGESGIRTRDTLLEYTHFPGAPLQPLEHLSVGGSASDEIILRIKSLQIYEIRPIFQPFRPKIIRFEFGTVAVAGETVQLQGYERDPGGPIDQSVGADSVPVRWGCPGRYQLRCCRAMGRISSARSTSQSG